MFPPNDMNNLEGVVQTFQADGKQPQVVALSSQSSLDQQKFPSSELASVESNQSIGIALPTTGYDEGSLVNRRLNDTIQVAILCLKHQKVLLTQLLTGFYFPFVCLRTDATVSSALVDKLKDCVFQMNLPKGCLGEPTLIDILHLQLPQSEKYLCRYTFRCEPKVATDCICESDNLPINCQWFLFNGQGINKAFLWGPEPMLLANKLLSSTSSPTICEILRTDILKYLHESMSNHPVTKLMTNMGMNETHLENMFVDYLEHTFPSIYMTRFTFEEFLRKSELIPPTYNIDFIFQAFMIDPSRGTQGHFYLEFDELVFGLLFMSLECHKQPLWLQMRLSYIFHYYSRANGDWNNETIRPIDLVTMSNEIKQLQQLQNIKSNSSNKSASKIADEMASLELGIDELHIRSKIIKGKVKTSRLESSIKQSPIETKINFEQFYKTFLTKQKANLFLKIEVFWLTTKSIKQHYEDNGAGADVPAKLAHLGLEKAELIKRRQARCIACREKPIYKMAEHTVQILPDGTMSEVISNDQWISVAKRFTLATREFSRETFNFNSFPNKLVDILANNASEAIRQITPSSILSNPFRLLTNPKNKSMSLTTGLESENVQQLFALVNDFLQNLPSKRSEVLSLTSPVVVIAEVNHLSELFQIEHRVTFICNLIYPLKYLIMVSLKDLRRIGIELLLLWVSNKMIIPDKFFMVLSIEETPTKMNEFVFWLTAQCTALTKGHALTSQLVEGLLKIIFYLQRPALIDNTLAVLLPTNETVHNSRVLLGQIDKQVSFLNNWMRNHELSELAPAEKMVAFALFTFNVNEGLGRVKRMYIYSIRDQMIVKQNRNAIRLVHSDNRAYAVLIYPNTIRVFYVDINRIDAGGSKKNLKK